MPRATVVTPRSRLLRQCFLQADMLNALTNVSFRGKTDINQPLLTNLDLIT
jgi:hypothetical protein